MIRPLDLQTAWKAIPTQGNTVLQQQAAVLYRTMQDLNEAHNRSLAQSEAVVKVTETAAGLFRPILQNDNRPSGYRLRPHLEDIRGRYRTRKKSKEAFIIYAPSGKAATRSNQLPGQFLNFQA